MLKNTPITSQEQLQEILKAGYIAQIPIRLTTDEMWKFKYNTTEEIRVFEINENDVVVVGTNNPLATHFEDMVNKSDNELEETLLQKCANFTVVNT